MSDLQPIRVEVAPGELIDKITILEIKLERIKDEKKLENIRLEHKELQSSLDAAVSSTEALKTLTHKLRDVNTKLWVIEDDIRECERKKEFGETFVELARSVYFTNDVRAQLKREINDLLGSRIKEEKDYKDYT